MERPKLNEVVHTLKELPDGSLYCTTPNGVDDIIDNESKLKAVIEFYEYQAEKLNAN